MKRLLLIVTMLSALFILNGCATSNSPPANQPLRPTGTLSPLNTSANPWTNVNPTIQGQYQATRR